MNDEGDGIEFILAESGYGALSRKPFVKITLRDVSVMIPPEDAIAFAVNLLQVAEGAETDAFLMEGLGLDEEQGIALMRLRRQYRRQEE